MARIRRRILCSRERSGWGTIRAKARALRDGEEFEGCDDESEGDEEVEG